jgi:hypothetical protein
MPEQIAPHRGRELAGVLDGTKPLGSIPNHHEDAPKVIRSVGMHTFIRAGIVYFALTQEPINTYKFLSSSASAIIVRSRQENNRLMGRLFGYTEEEIDVFIESNLDCACGDCKGGFSGGKLT